MVMWTSSHPQSTSDPASAVSNSPSNMKLKRSVSLVSMARKAADIKTVFFPWASVTMQAGICCSICKDLSRIQMGIK